MPLLVTDLLEESGEGTEIKNFLQSSCSLEITAKLRAHIDLASELIFLTSLVI